jgi:hypothetical protein
MAVLLEPAGAVPSDWVAWLSNLGTAGIVLVLLMTGVLETKRARLALEADRDAWRKAFESEQASHQVTREALAASDARGSAAIESAKTLTTLLEGLGHERARGGGGVR